MTKTFNNQSKTFNPSHLRKDARGDWKNIGYYQNVKTWTYSWKAASSVCDPLFPRCGFIAERRGKSFFRHNGCPELALELLLEGKITYEEDDEQFVATPGSLYCIHHHAHTSISSSPSGAYRKLVLAINGSLLDMIVESLKLQNCRGINLTAWKHWEQRFMEIFELLEKKEPGSERLVAARTYELLLELSELHQNYCNPIPEALRLALHFIDKDFDKDIRLPDICNAARVSPATLVRLFHDRLGKSPQEYLIDLRLESARALLLFGNLSFKEIAWKCGYNSPLYFSTAFRKKYGMSPRAYRNSKPDKDPYPSPSTASP